MPTSMRRNDMKGNAAVDRSSRTKVCNSARECGPATDKPTYSMAQAAR